MNHQQHLHILKPVGFMTGNLVAFVNLPAHDIFALAASLLGGAGSFLIGLAAILTFILNRRKSKPKGP